MRITLPWIWLRSKCSYKVQVSNTRSCYIVYIFPINFLSPPIWRGFLSLYSQSNCILALRLYSQGACIGCLPHQSFVRGGRVCCELWSYCSGVFFSLMQPAKLVQCIKCGGDGYLPLTFPFFFTCTSLMSSTVPTFWCR